MRKHLFTLFVLAGLSSQLSGQIINTIGGNGIAGYTGDGLLATGTRLNGPNGMTIDGVGNIYICDRDNNRIRKINTSGIISTIAGNGTGTFAGDGGAATAASINHTGDICIVPSGEIYITDALNHRIRKINTSGIISTIAGTGIAGYSGDGAAATLAKLNIPYGMVIDAGGTIYFADQQNHRVRKISTSGIITTVAGTGVAGYTGDMGPATAAKLNFPNFVCLDPVGNLYITDNGNHCIRKVTAAGIISTVAGDGIVGSIGDGGLATAARLNYPAGIRFDTYGNLYIADTYNQRVRKVNGAGIISTVAGIGTTGYTGDGGPATLAQMNLPIDLVITTSNDLYVAENHNHCIRKVGALISNSPPTFIKGISQNLLVCAIESTAPIPIDTFLSVLDPDIAQTLVWGVITSPAHGTLSGSYSTTSGTTVTPSSFTYIPTVGYTGTDMFQISVTDGTASDTITINVTVSLPPVASTISGADSVCPGDTVILSASVPGGAWSSSTTTVATVSSTGTVTGIAPGLTAITYTVTNVCGTATATHPLYVKPFSECPSFVGNISGSKQMALYPNPSDGHFTVTLYSGTTKEITVSIFDLLGRKVGEFMATANTPTDISVTAPSGIYVLKATDAHTTWAGRLFLKN